MLLLVLLVLPLPLLVSLWNNNAPSGLAFFSETGTDSVEKEYGA
jgi:hypothetical protein